MKKPYLSSYKEDKFIFVGQIVIGFFAIAFVFWLFTHRRLNVISLSSFVLLTVLFFHICLKAIRELKKYIFSYTRYDNLYVQGSATKKELVKLFVFVILWILFLNGILIFAISLRYPGLSIVSFLYKDFGLYLDVHHYLKIAQDWYSYQNSDIAFSPFYPVLITVFNFVNTENSYLIVGMIISSVSAILCGFVFFHLAMLDMESSDAFRAVKYMYIIPSGFFIILPMSESIYLLFSLIFFYFLIKKEWVLVFFTGFCLGLTKNSSIVLLIPAVIEYIAEHREKIVREEKSSLMYEFDQSSQDVSLTVEEIEVLFSAPQKKDSGFKFFGLLGVCLGLTCILIINYYLYKNPFQFITALKDFQNQGPDFFWSIHETLVNGIVDKFRYVKDVIFSKYLPNYIFCFGTLVLTLAGINKIRVSYTFYSLGYFIYVFSITNFYSAPRLLLCLFPLALTCGSLTGKKKYNIALTALYLMGFIAYFFMFLIKWQVF